MERITATRAILAVSIFVLGSLQGWDSDVPSVGLFIVVLVSLAIALPPVALLAPLEQRYFLGAFVLSFLLLILAQLISPIPLAGPFIVLVLAVMWLNFSGIFAKNINE